MQPFADDSEIFIQYNNSFELEINGIKDVFKVVNQLDYTIDNHSFLKIKSITNDVEYIVPLAIVYFKIKYEKDIRYGSNEFVNSNGIRSYIQYVIKPCFNGSKAFTFNVLKNGLNASEIDNYYNLTNRQYKSIDDALIDGWNDYIKSLN